jgi:hypothetical protein
VTLHGTVTTTFDNVSPGTDLGDELALDPMEEVTLVTLRQPVCLAPENSSRPVIQPSVTVVELVSGDDVAWTNARRHVGKLRTIEGTLSENVWWHYKATMRLSVTSIR